MKSWMKVAGIAFALCLALLQMQAQTPAPSSQRQFLDGYCEACHDDRLKTADESGHGFDNVIVGDLSPTLLDRYISAAQKISHLAVGRTESSLQNDVIRLPADLTQEEHVAGLPIGTRGGVLLPYTFPQDGEYDIQIWLARDLAGSVGGLREARPHEMLLLLDRETGGTFTIKKPANPDEDTTLDKNLKLRVAA